MKKVDTAIENLNSKGLKAAINWNRAKDSCVIRIQNEAKGKELSGVLSVKDRNVEIDIAVSNYNPQYVKEMLKTAFQKVGIPQVSILLNDPEEGDKILVENTICIGMLPSQEIILPAMTMYFAKNSHYVICDGNYLGNSFRARFMQQRPARCQGGVIQQYCEFLLIAKV